jgi:hypothetical protein
MIPAHRALQRIVMVLGAMAAVGGCSLAEQRLPPCNVIDLELRGCFERTTDPAGEIIIAQDRCSQLTGVGFGIDVLDPTSGAPQGWSFTGTVEAPGTATLSVTPEDGPRRSARVTKPRPDELILQFLGGDPPRVLQRCAAGAEP